MKRFGFVIAALLAALLSVSTAMAASFFGDAAIVTPGNASPRAAQLRSDADPGFGGIDFDVAAGTTFADFDQLATDYKFTEGSCGGGSPRFQVNVVDPVSGDDGNIFVYIGAPPSYTGCPQNAWLNTGDLLDGTNPIDTSQLSGGTFYDPYASALIKFGGYTVTGVQLVADSGWAVGGVQTVIVDNTNIDGAVYTYEKPVAESTDDCKDGGFLTHTRADGSEFKNQGDCIQYVNTGQ